MGSVVMIKGVNRQIIEITDISSQYYERALLIVKPEFSYVNKTKLEKEARDFLGNVGIKCGNKKKKINKVVKLVVAMAFAAIIMVVLISVMKNVGG